MGIAMCDVDPNGEFQGGSPKWGSTSTQMGNFKVVLHPSDRWLLARIRTLEVRLCAIVPMAIDLMIVDLVGCDCIETWLFRWGVLYTVVICD